MLDMVKTVHDLMRENNLYGEVYSNRDNPNIVYVDISWETGNTIMQNLIILLKQYLNAGSVLQPLWNRTVVIAIRQDIPLYGKVKRNR